MNKKGDATNRALKMRCACFGVAERRRRRRDAWRARGVGQRAEGLQWGAAHRTGCPRRISRAVGLFPSTQGGCTANARHLFKLFLYRFSSLSVFLSFSFSLFRLSFVWPFALDSNRTAVLVSASRLVSSLRNSTPIPTLCDPNSLPTPSASSSPLVTLRTDLSVALLLFYSSSVLLLLSLLDTLHVLEPSATTAAVLCRPRL